MRPRLSAKRERHGSRHHLLPDDGGFRLATAIIIITSRYLIEAPRPRCLSLFYENVVPVTRQEEPDKSRRQKIGGASFPR
jgi:hypothetical protein